MLPKSELNDNQKSNHTVLEESKAKRDAPSDELTNNSIETGIRTSIHLCD